MAIDVERLVAEIDADPAKAIAALKAFQAASSAAAKDEHKRITVDVDDSDLRDATRTANNLTAALASAGGAGNNFGRGMGNAAGGANSFRRSMDGVGSSLMKGIAQLSPFYALLTTLPGAFSAAAAGAGALVGALGPLVGLLGTIPVGLGALGGGLTAAITGFAGVGDGITALGAKQAEVNPLMDQMNDKARQVALALRGLRDAQRAAAESAEELRAAQKALNEARHEAKESLQDQRFAVRQAVLSEEQAILRLKKAQEDLAAAQDATGESAKQVALEVDDFTGKVYEVTKLSADATDQAGSEAAAKLELRQAELDLAMARDNTKDQTRLLNEMEKKGIKNSDIMVAARERITDAQWAYKKSIEGVKDAEYNLAQARKAQASAAASASAATTALQEAMAKLSPEGKRFVRFMVNEFLPAWGEVRKQVQAGLLPGMQRGLRSLMGMFDTLGGGLTKFGTTMGNQFAKFMGHWAEAGNQDRIANTFSNLNGVLRRMLRVATPLSEILLQVTDAATPLTNRVLKGLLKQLGRLDKWMDGKKGKSAMKEFFGDAGDFGGLWLGLLGDMGRALWGVIKAAEPLARWLLGEKGLGGFFENLANDVNSLTGQKKLTAWFDSWIPSLKEVGGLLGDLLDVLFTSGTGGKEGAFFKTIKSLRENFVPSLEKLFKALDKSDFGPQFAKFLGYLADGITWFVKHDGGLTTALAFLNDIVDVFQRANKASSGALGNVIGSLVVTLGGLAILARVGTWVRKLLNPLGKLALLLPSLKGLLPGKGGGEGGFLGLGKNTISKAKPIRTFETNPAALGGGGSGAPVPTPKGGGGKWGGILAFFKGGATPLAATIVNKYMNDWFKSVFKPKGGIKGDPGKIISNIKITDSMGGWGDKVGSKVPFFDTAGEAARKAIEEADAALAALIRNGNIKEAREQFRLLKEEAKKQGVEIDTLRAKFPKYSEAIKKVPTTHITEFLVPNLAEQIRRIREFGGMWDGLSDKTITLHLDNTRAKNELDEITGGQPPNRSGGGDWNGGRQRRGITRLVGEHGPELFTPSSNGYIRSASETASMYSGSHDALTASRVEAAIERGMANARHVQIENTFNEKVDPMHVSRELAWRLG